MLLQDLQNAGRVRPDVSVITLHGLNRPSVAATNAFQPLDDTFFAPLNSGLIPRGLHPLHLLHLFRNSVFG